MIPQSYIHCGDTKSYIRADSAEVENKVQVKSALPLFSFL